MRIAIASTGLGHVARGIETWALETAQALHSAGEDVTLYGSIDTGAALLKMDLEVRSLPCLRRDDPKNEAWLKRLPRGIWRLGITGSYGLEQWTFWLRLWRELKKGNYDILHVQDPMLAHWCRLFRKVGLLKTREILAHGTEEKPDFLKKFEYLQHLAPWHLDQTVDALGWNDAPEGWTALPNFVDVTRFCPSEDMEADSMSKSSVRRDLGIPQEARVFICVAAVKRFHKRIDYLIDEFSTYLNRLDGGSSPVHLLIAGSQDRETAELLDLAQTSGKGRIHFLLNQPRVRMPEILRAGDCFVLSSLFEMMPIAILESLATGLPVLANDHPVLEWMVGPGGRCSDLSKRGALAEIFLAITDDWIQDHGRKARQHALDLFSTDSVVRRYREYYEKVMTA